MNFTLTSEHSRELQNPLSSEHSRELHSVLLLAQHPRTRKGFFPNLLWVFDLFDLILGVDRQIFFNIPIYWYWTLDHLWRVVCDNSKKIFRDYFFLYGITWRQIVYLVYDSFLDVILSWLCLYIVLMILLNIKYCQYSECSYGLFNKLIFKMELWKKNIVQCLFWGHRPIRVSLPTGNACENETVMWLRQWFILQWNSNRTKITNDKETNWPTKTNHSWKKIIRWKT